MSKIRYPFTQIPSPGTTIEIAPGIKWVRMPLPLALDHVNLYLIEDGDGWAVVDTGMRGDETQEYWQRIFDHELDGKPITRVFATHMHPDHVGQAGWITERYRIPLFMTLGEYFNARTFASMTPGSFSWTAEQFFQRAGLPDEFIDGMRKHLPRFPSVVEPLPTAYRRLRDGDELRIGNHLWQVVVGYGHSNEHACLHSAELGILISGDQVIPSITSNVSVMPTEPEANPLRYWLESHQRFAELPADTLVLPAHKLPFFGLRERLVELTHHHEERMDLITETCAEPRTALELLPVLFDRELDHTGVTMALGETLAHLHLLMERKRIERVLTEEGTYTYNTRTPTRGPSKSASEEVPEC